MRSIPSPYRNLIEFIKIALPWGVLAVLLLFTYAKFSNHPYQGFREDSSGRILRIYYDKTIVPTLLVDDRIIKVGLTPWIDFQSDLRRPFFDVVQPGHLVPLLVERDGQLMTVLWEFPTSNSAENLDLAVSEGWLAFIFWLAGIMTTLMLRPKNELRRLIIAFNYLTAIWLVMGSGLSFYHIWDAAIFLRMFVWFSVPVYLHLHWVYPTPFTKLPRFFVWSCYFAAFALAAAEWFQILPKNLYFLGFLIGISGSVLLLLTHAALQPNTRRELRLVLIAGLLSLAPAILVGLIGTLNIPSLLSGAGTLGFPFLALIYFYTSYRRQLGKSELRVNKLIAIYLFVVLFGMILLLLIVLASLWLPLSGAENLVGVIAIFFTMLVSALGFPKFQSLVEQRLLGIQLPSAQLIEIFSARITTSASPAKLESLLRDEVLPSLLVREFVFLQFDQHDLSKVIFSIGLTNEQYPNEVNISELINAAGVYRSLHLLKDDQPCLWARLTLLLKVEDKLIGLWLFGRRDPDDLYSQLEISILQSLANQTAIAQSNILQAEHLKTLSMVNINRHEEERQRVAHDLHDSVLNQIAALSMSSWRSDPSTKFSEKL